jgi:hypothetical protein
VLVLSSIRSNPACTLDAALPLSSITAAPQRIPSALKLPRKNKGRDNYDKRFVRSAAEIE